MITSSHDLTELARNHPQLAGMLADGDWYLVGSRAAAAGDDLSDWDTVVFTREDGGAEVPGDVLDEAFAVARPTLDGPLDLGFHVRWRQAHAVELQVLGPSGRAERERAQPAEWAFELRHAVALHLGAGVGEGYRTEVATRFASECSDLARQAYEGFRHSRSEAVSALPRADPATQSLTAAACVGDAARFWLLGLGEPHPAGKWLLHSLRQHPGTGPLLAAMELCLDIRQAADRRFQALWTLWELVDTHASDQPSADALLADSPFRRS